MKDLTPQEIEQKLMKLPYDLLKLNQKVVELHRVYLEAEELYENTKDNAFLTAKASNPEMTGPELKAHSQQVAVQERGLAIIAQAKYEAAKNQAECCDKLNGNMQSIVKLRSSEIRAGI
jgi:hypothetical protein